MDGLVFPEGLGYERIKKKVVARKPYCAGADFGSRWRFRWLGGGFHNWTHYVYYFLIPLTIGTLWVLAQNHLRSIFCPGAILLSGLVGICSEYGKRLCFPSVWLPTNL
jgi:hypothetical protein